MLPLPSVFFDEHPARGDCDKDILNWVTHQGRRGANMFAIAMTAIKVAAVNVFAVDVVNMEGTKKKAVKTLEVCGCVWCVEE